MGQIIAALDLGTSKTIAFVAQKDFSGKLSILHSETTASKEAIRRGLVYNTREAFEIVSKLIRRLNVHLPSPIEKIYVGIGGQSLHTEMYSIKKNVENGTVSQHLLDSLKDEALGYEPEFAENLGVCSWEYYVDGRLESNPRGAVASAIEARFQIVVGNPILKRTLNAAITQNPESNALRKDISIADYFIVPLATAKAVLTQREKELGCALVEFGAGVTYVSVYKNGSLKYLITLPLGGLVITKDIRSLNVSEEEAEELKTKYGSAISRLSDSGTVPVKGVETSLREVELRDLNWIIEARIDEILKNVLHQIDESGYAQALDAGIVITGGGALLQDLPEFIRNQTGKEVRLAQAKAWINNVEAPLPPSESCMAGLLLLGKENCLKEKEIKGKAESISISSNKQNKVESPQERPVPSSTPTSVPTPTATAGKKKGLFTKFFDKGLELFKEEDFDNNENNENEK
jgi:cell division protein FtsA